MELDEAYMRRALRLAARAAGRTSPNPLVGALVVRDGAVVGQGWYRENGATHAEANALAAAGPRARGATVYLTLEPHAFQGRTPPCADALIAAQVARAVIAIRDPEPRTNGKGVRRLRAAGIEVAEGVCADEASRLNEGYLSRLRQGRPHVTLKLATTLDGRVAVHGRRYLSGKFALRESHRLRDRSDAVMVGIGTVLEDDPQLTVREVKGRDPLRVVIDTEARTPQTARLIRGGDPQRTIIFIARDADERRTQRLRDSGVLIVRLPRAGSGVDLGAALRWLAEHGVNTLLSEGGPHIAAGLLGAGLVDRLMLDIAPVLGGEGPPAFPALAARTLSGVTTRRLGDDIIVTAELA